MTTTRRGFFAGCLQAAAFALAQRIMPSSLVTPRAGVLTANISHLSFYGFALETPGAIVVSWADLDESLPAVEPGWCGWRAGSVSCMKCGEPAPSVYQFPDDLGESLACPCCGIDWFRWSA